MVGKDLAVAVNDVNKMKLTNAVPGTEDTEDSIGERSPNLIPNPDNNQVTGDMQPIRKIEEAARKRKEKLLEEAREDAKADFEAQRKEMLDRVPENYKKMFGQVGFAKWGKASLPALIVGPYDVPMGEASPREKWIKMLNMLEHQGRLANVTYIVYWYGAKSPNEYYSFVPKSAFIGEASKDYQTQMKKLKAAEAKVKSNENASMATQELARKYREMQEDLRKPPEERKHGDFQEVYQLLSMSDVEELLSDVEESGDDDTGEEKAESKPAPKKRGEASTADGDDTEAPLKSQGKKMKKETPSPITEALEQSSEEQRAQTKPGAMLAEEPK